MISSTHVFIVSAIILAVAYQMDSKHFKKIAISVVSISVVYYGYERYMKRMSGGAELNSAEAAMEDKRLLQEEDERLMEAAEEQSDPENVMKKEEEQSAGSTEKVIVPYRLVDAHWTRTPQYGTQVLFAGTNSNPDAANDNDDLAVFENPECCCKYNE